MRLISKNTVYYIVVPLLAAALGSGISAFFSKDGNSIKHSENNSGIITQGQTGGTNTIVNQAPSPELKLLSNEGYQAKDGYLMTYNFEVRNALGRSLTIRIQNNALIDAHIDNALIQFNNVIGEGYFQTTIPNVSGTYSLRLKFKNKPEPTQDISQYLAFSP